MTGKYILRIPFDQYNVYTDSYVNTTGHKLFETYEEAVSYREKQFTGDTKGIHVYKRCEEDE